MAGTNTIEPKKPATIAASSISEAIFEGFGYLKGRIRYSMTVMKETSVP